MTRARAGIVNRQALAAAARRIGLGEFVLLGRGTRMAGAHRLDSVLADAFEAVIGAALLDGGIEASRAVAQRAFDTSALPPHLPLVGKDYKSQLQELTQAAAKVTPTYTTITGPPHARKFQVRVSVEGRVMGEGTGKSKAEAEQGAARAALDGLGAEA